MNYVELFKSHYEQNIPITLTDYHNAIHQWNDKNPHLPFDITGGDLVSFYNHICTTWRTTKYLPIKHKRKIIQIDNDYALCDDGTLWTLAYSGDNTGEWVRQPDIPQD